MSFGAVAVGLGTAAIGSMAAGDAADKQADSAAAATAAQKQMFDKQVSLQAPFRDAGLLANNKLMELLGLRVPEREGEREAVDAIFKQNLDAANKAHMAKYGFGVQDSPALADRSGWLNSLREKAQRTYDQQNPQAEMPSGGEFGSLMRNFSMEDFETDPGYEFRRTEGMRGVEGSAAARGGLLSGAAQKAIQKYGQGLASQEYGNAYGRYNADQTNQYNRLAGIVNTGQGATNQVSNAAGQFGQQQANNLIGAGNAQASGIMGQANAITGGINQGFNTYQNNQLMNLIRNPGTSGGGFYPYGGSSYDVGNVS